MLQNSLQETLELISFPKTFRDKDKAKGETVDLMIEKKKKRRVVASEERRRVAAGATALEPHPCFLDSQQLCFFFFCFSMCVCVCVFFFFQGSDSKEARNREKRSDHGSQNREVQPRFARVPVFFFHRAVLDAKRTVKMNGSRVFWLDRTV